MQINMKKENNAKTAILYHKKIFTENNQKNLSLCVLNSHAHQMLG